ncbi:MULTISPECIES: PASTA domain-containing protein [Flammeovirga]|uniref:PASTA domain-containing protein n=1 Tax=Flammeovirga agarivorans TaxID=2726742 RepID=A0A7X8SHF2_9BACT|nr:MULTISPECIES: PASTA domain-containing protein [Flammeovirga]NLR90173.1 PASTA domain-containing protein [Flammeovirga agarivorans]
MDKDKIKKIVFGDSPLSLLINLVLIAVAFVVILFLFFQVYLPSSTKHAETVTVPKVDSMSLVDATKRLEAAGLRVAVFDSAPVNYDAGLPYLTVLAATPKAGEKVKDNRKIYLTVNPAQPEAITLDDLLTSSLKNAAEVLKTKGITPGKVTRVPDRYEGILEVRYRGTMIQKYDKKRGKKILTKNKVHRGGKVDIVVGDGLGKQDTEVPNLVGMSEGDAEFALFGQGLGKGRVQYIPYDTIPGVVVKQYPSAEKDEEGKYPRIRFGRTIDLWVSEFTGKQ